MRAVFVKGQSGYDATRIFVDELASAFERRGYAIAVIDALAGPDLGRALIREAAAGPVAFVFTIGILGELRDQQGRSLGQIFGAPHVLQHVDYPLTHLKRLEETAAETALLVVDQTHVHALHSTFGKERYAHVAFGPHGAVGQPPEPDSDAGQFVARRPIPVLFAGTYYGPEQPPWANEQGVLRDIFDAALEAALSAEFVPALEAMDLSLRAHGLDPIDPGLNRVRKYATMIHEQVRRIRRRALLDAVGAAQLPVQIVGSGYEGRFDHFRTFQFLGTASLHEVSRLMRTARLVLNINANFGEGSHERPLTAMLAGAAVASDHSTWWAKHFVENQDLLLYRWQDLDAGLARVTALIDDPETAWSLASAGQRRVVAEHRFDQRTQVILEAAQAVRARRPDLFAALSA